jgi:prepilin-type N-terminal cleavage/methylation domain-containing protein
MNKQPTAHSPQPTAQRGLTLIELVMAIIIGAVILIPVSVVVVESVRNAFLPEHLTIASGLLEREIGRVTNLRFGDVDNDGPNAYTGNFSDYSYQVSYYYVDGGDLITLSGSPPTDYKRVTITISRSGYPNITGVTLVTNN